MLEVGNKAPEFKLVTPDLTEKSLSDYKGQRVVLNIFPSIDTGVCAASTRAFNKMAGDLENTKVVCVSRDLPFAMARFCGAEGLDSVETLSDFKKGKFEYKADKTGVVHVSFGKANFSKNQLIDNLTSLYQSIEQNRPSGVKGKYFKSLFICSSMGPSIQLDLNAFD